MTPLTMELLRSVIDSLPPPPERYVIAASPRNCDFIRKSLESSGLTHAMPIFKSEYLPMFQSHKVIRRKDYTTRAGYRRARNFWRCQNRRAGRESDKMSWMIRDKFSTMRDAMDSFMVSQMDRMFNMNAEVRNFTPTKTEMTAREAIIMRDLAFKEMRPR